MFHHDHHWPQKKKCWFPFTGNRFPSDSIRPKPQVSPLVMLLVDLAHSNPAGSWSFWRWNRNHPAPKKVLVLENRRWRLWPRYWSKASSVFMCFQAANHDTTIDLLLLHHHHHWLVVHLPLWKNMKVTWDHYSQYQYIYIYMWKNNPNVPNHQPDPHDIVASLNKQRL